MRSLVFITAMVLAGGVAAPAQQSTNTEKSARKDDGATYGRIKEVKAGQKIVIAVDGALDKTYDLADAKRTVTLAENLAVGDPVKVMETDKKGVKSVQIVRDVSRGERSRSEERK